MHEGTLKSVVIDFDERASCAVMLVSAGYPDIYAKGKPMVGFSDVHDSILFHAGTIVKEHEIVTNGGRVIAITSYGADLSQALSKSYANAERIGFEGKYFRKDIGWEFQ